MYLSKSSARGRKFQITESGYTPPVLVRSLMLGWMLLKAARKEWTVHRSAWTLRPLRVDHVPQTFPAPGAARRVPVSLRGVLVQKRGLRVRRLSREVVPGRARLRLRHRRRVLPEPVRVSLHVHGGRSIVRAPQVSARPPPLHTRRVQGLLSRVRGNGARVRVRGQDVQAAGGVLGEFCYTHSIIFLLSFLFKAKS